MEKIFILPELLPALGANKLIFLCFLTSSDNLLLLQELKSKFLSKVLIEGPLILLLTEIETSVEHKVLAQLVT